MKKIAQIIISLAFVISLSAVASAAASTVQTDGADLQNSLTELRQERKLFNDEKAKEANERSLAAEEKVQSKRAEVEKRRAEAETRMESKRKTVLLKLIDIEVKQLNKTNERVQKMPNISDELKAKIKTEIESALAAIDAKKADVGNASGKDTIKKLAKDIRDLFKSRRDIVKKIVDAIHASRADKALEIANERIAAIKSKIKELKDAGQDTSELEAGLSDASDEISKAGERIKAGALRDANEKLKSAYEKFKDIAKKSQKTE